MVIDTPAFDQLNVGDTILIPGGTGYDYETNSWPTLDDLPVFAGKIEHLDTLGSGAYVRHTVRGYYLDDHQAFAHLMTPTDTITRTHAAA